MVSVADEVRPVERPVVAAATIGNALEFFDFTIFSFLAVFIAPLFFPAYSDVVQILFVVGTFGVGFVMRPVGGFLIGLYADRVGRKPALVLTVSLMALGCLLIGLAPTYSQIGVGAPLLIMLARLIQGFSAGGEVGAAGVLLVESAPNYQRGYFSSWQFGSQSLGVMFGALAAILLTTFLTTDQIHAWGWRIPFLVGASIAPVGWYIRRSVEETIGSWDPSGRPREPQMRLTGARARDAIKGVVLIIGGTTTSYIVTLYLPTYAIKQLGLSPRDAMISAVIAGGIGFLVAPLVGQLSDLVGRKILIWVSRGLTIVALYPCFLWLNNNPAPVSLYGVSAILSSLLVVQMTSVITMISELFPGKMRATGMGTVYGVGVSIFGGFAQFIATALVASTGSNFAPAWYLMFCLVGSSLVLPWCEDRTGLALD